MMKKRALVLLLTLALGTGGVFSLAQTDEVPAGVEITNNVLSRIAFPAGSEREYTWQATIDGAELTVIDSNFPDGITITPNGNKLKLAFSAQEEGLGSAEVTLQVEGGALFDDWSGKKLSATASYKVHWAAYSPEVDLPLVLGSGDVLLED